MLWCWDVLSAKTQCSMVGTGDESLRGVAHVVVGVEKVSYFSRWGVCCDCYLLSWLNSAGAAGYRAERVHMYVDSAGSTGRRSAGLRTAGGGTYS